MWKPNKKILFICTVILSVSAGIALNLVNWNAVKNGQEVFKELNLPILLLFLSVFYLIMYIQKRKETN